MTKHARTRWFGRAADQAAPEPEQWNDGQPPMSIYHGLSEAGRYGDDLLRSLAGRNPDLLDAAEEVAAEQGARLFVISQERRLTYELLAYLRQEAVTTYHGRYVHHGVWLLVTLPAQAETADEEGSTGENLGAEPAFDSVGEDDEDEVGTLLEQLGSFGADIVLYLVELEQGWSADDTTWVGRLRTLGAPLLPVIVDTGRSAEKLGASDGGDEDERKDQGRSARETIAACVHRLAGVKPTFVTIDGAPVNEDAGIERIDGNKAPSDVVALTHRIVSLRPRVAVALAQDVAWCRPILARRIIRTGALFTALLSAQPVPLLDLPFQVVLQWKVALQLAAIYGRPGLDYRSREMVGTIAWNLIIRFAMQQTVRLVPVFGWLLSAVIGGISTALLGHGLVTIYENEDRWNLEHQGKRVLDRAGAAVAPVRNASARAAGAVREQTDALTQRVGRVGKAVYTAWNDESAGTGMGGSLIIVPEEANALAEAAQSQASEVQAPEPMGAMHDQVHAILVTNLDTLFKHDNGNA